MSRFLRKTLTQEAVFEGRGLHSGLPVRAFVHPSEKGLWFRRGGSRWAATPENVTDTSRCTRLGEVSTVEHLMAAFAGLGVTDAEVEVDGEEMPAMDGAAREYCDHILQTGLTTIGDREVHGPFARVYHVEGDVKIAVSAGDGLWRYEYELGERWPGSQPFEFSFARSSFVDEVSRARTFALAEEMEMVRAAGLGKGLDETTAFVIGKAGYENKVLFEDEPARHKLLDLIGDVYLAGVPPSLLRVVAQRSGHRTNVAAAVKLREHVSFA